MRTFRAMHSLEGRAGLEDDRERFSWIESEPQSDTEFREKIKNMTVEGMEPVHVCRVWVL